VARLASKIDKARLMRYDFKMTKKIAQTIAAFLFFSATQHAQTQEIKAINDRFMIDGNIWIGVDISANLESLTIEVTVENNSAEKVMLWNTAFVLPLHISFINENGERGDYAPGRVRYDSRVTNESVSVLEPNESLRFTAQREYKKTENSFKISHRTADYLFENPEQVKIVIGYKASSAIDKMKALYGDLAVLPEFSKTYVLAEFK
jgi:hypothetical protein